MLQNARNKLMLAGVTAMTILGYAGVASAQTDPLLGEDGAISTVQDKLISYAGPVALALVAVGLAWVGVRLVPRILRFISSRLG